MLIADRWNENGTSKRQIEQKRSVDLDDGIKSLKLYNYWLKIDIKKKYKN